MSHLKDLHIACYEKVFAKGNSVCMRYTVEGTHNGAPRDGNMA